MSGTEGSRTSTGVKRLSSAGSRSMCLRYSSWVVAPMQGNSPRARPALSSLAASCGPSPVDPAPITVCTSSMNTTTRPSARRTSSWMPRSFSEKEPRSWVPESTLAMSSSTTTRGEPWASSCWATPSTMAVLPTPASPTRSGLLVRRFPRTSRVCSTSISRPTRGSSRPAAASSVRLRPSCDSQGNVGGVEREGRAGAGRGRRGGGRGGAGGRPRGEVEHPGLRTVVLDRLALEVGLDGLVAERRGRAARGRGRRPVGRLGHAPQPPGHARRVVGERDVAERRQLQAAGGEQLVRRALAHPGHGDEQVDAVGLVGPQPLGDLAGPLAEVALEALRFLRRARHGEQDPVLVDAALAQQHLGPVGNHEECEEEVSAGEALVHVPRDVARLGEDLGELHRLDDGHWPARCDIGRIRSIIRRVRATPAPQSRPRSRNWSSSSPRKWPTSWRRVTRISSSNSSRSRA